MNPPPEKRIGTTTRGGLGESTIPVAGLALLAVAALSVGLALLMGGDGPAPTYGPAPQGDQFPVFTAAPCSATTPQGNTYDPCATMPGDWQAGFWNPLNANAYFPKWKAANPGEWAALDAWRRDGSATSPQPTVRTGYGGVVRWGIAVCKSWTNAPSSCAVP